MSDDQTESADTAGGISGGVYSCEDCESLLDMSTWTPTEIDDGTVYRFCDEDCRAAWQDD